jgi:hypothetical protein
MKRKLPKFVNGYIDATGKARFYLRRKGQRHVALPGLPWSPEFMAAYEQALAGSTSAILNHVKPDSCEALVHEYLKSETFKLLADETQRTRRNILLRFAREHGLKRYNNVTTRACDFDVEGEVGQAFRGSQLAEDGPRLNAVRSRLRQVAGRPDHRGQEPVGQDQRLYDLARTAEVEGTVARLVDAIRRDHGMVVAGSTCNSSRDSCSKALPDAAVS